MKMMLLVMMRNLLRIVGDDEVGRSREQGVDLRKRRFYWIELEDEDKVAKNFIEDKVDQPSRVCSPGAVGGVNLQRARLPSDESVQLVKAGVLKNKLKRFVAFVKGQKPFTDCDEFVHLIVMDPSNRVESCNLSNVLWQLVSTRPLCQNEEN